MAAIVNADVDAIVERLYGKDIHLIGYSKKVPLWARMPKHSDFYETTYETRNRFGLAPSGSHLFTQSRARTGASPYGAFRQSRAETFGSIQFESQALRSIRKNSRRGVSLVKEETDSSFQRMTKRISQNCYRNQGGAITQVSSGGATQTITVSDRTQLINIHNGMFLVTSNTDGTSGAVDANATQVESVNREAGTITTAAASWDAIAGFSDNDFIFPSGDFGLAMTGLDDWIPSTAPTDTFLSQDRSLDPVYLGGVRYTAAAGAPDGTIYRTLCNAAAEGVIHGADTTDVFMHTLDYNKLLLEAEARIEYKAPLARTGAYTSDETDGTMMDIGLAGVRVQLPTGVVDVMPDLDCPPNIFWMLDMRTFGFHGLGMKEPQFIVDDGGKRFGRMTQSDVNGIEATLGLYGNIICTAPGCNIRVDATAVLA